MNFLQLGHVEALIQLGMQTSKTIEHAVRNTVRKVFPTLNAKNNMGRIITVTHRTIVITIA